MTSTNKYKIKNILVPQKKINYQSLYDISEKDILPCSYQLTIKPDFEKNLFKGEIKIPLLVIKETNIIKFHSANIKLDNVKVLLKESSKEILPSNVSIDNFFESVTLEFNENFQKDLKPILLIEYTGIINKEVHDKYEEVVGFVKDTYSISEKEKRNIYYTKCLYANARRIFPCWDYPSLKIPLNFSIIIPNDMDILFNTKIKSVFPYENSNLKKIEFETTLPMSTINTEFIIGEFNFIERISDIYIKNDKLSIRLYSVKNVELKQYENILLILEQILYFQEQYLKKEYLLNKLDIFLLPNYESYSREIERNEKSICMGSGTLGLHIFNKEKFDKITNNNMDYISLINNPTLIFSLSQEIAKIWIRNMISPYDITEYWFFEALATNISLLSLKESKMNFDFDLEYEFYMHYTKNALDSTKLSIPPRKEFDAYLKNIIDESQIYSGISIMKMFLEMYTIYNNIEYFYDEEEEDEEEDMEEEEEGEDMDIEDEEIELYDIKDTLKEFVRKYENKVVREGEFFRCFINQIGKYTMANIFEFWISKSRGYPIIKILKDEINIKKNKLSIELKQLPNIYPKEEEYEFYEYQNKYSREPRKIPIFITLYEYELETGNLVNEFSYIELLTKFDQIINISVVKKDDKRATGFFYIIHHNSSSFYRVIYPRQILNNILNHQNLLSSIDKYKLWEDNKLYSECFIQKNKELKSPFEEDEKDVMNNQLMMIKSLSNSYDSNILYDIIKTLNKILMVYSIYDNIDDNKASFIEKVRIFRNDIFYNIYNQVKNKIYNNHNNNNNNNINILILIECLKINDERIIKDAKENITDKQEIEKLIPYKVLLRINNYTSKINEDLEKDYIINFVNENTSQIDDFYLNLIIEKIAMKFSIPNILGMLDLLKEKLINNINDKDNQNGIMNNYIYIIKRLLILVSERVIDPTEILLIHESLMGWIMTNFKSLVNILGYSLNLAIIINSTLTNLYKNKDLETIENYFINFLANETKQENEECQTESGTYSKSSFLLRSAALLNDIMPVVCKRQHILFNKFKTNLSRNVNADNTVGQPSRANADPISDPSGIG
ncbi:hypothetical protein BCR32DRAFT_289439 [Anaeromyces robustus]|uniref:Aminopeptidase N-like N-terminal domain-containing protein n=1 Tax=Anaeromyces robustus TaxID=1754192 RepID=A0A1Y1XNS6_9FUNG|nr:hypothetical protein BCR32DRAFT_289439 [Anaeromyces robustus]|eukprot:ORX87325.1 hypothetical protein BCR32DRAFT_289439 [Anaeromyces robustus]